MAKKIDKTKTKWLDPKDWSIRNNTARKKGKESEGKHPSIVVGKNGKKSANLGITHDPKRGHHPNKKLNKNPNPADRRTAYVRDDLTYTDKKHLKEHLIGYKIDVSDIDTIKLIIKKSDKNHF